MLYNKAEILGVWEQLCLPKAIGHFHLWSSGHIHVMALTATATISTRRKILLSLNMKDCHVISRNPRKANIKYIVREKLNMEDTFSPIIEDVSQNDRNAERTIIFCRNFRDCFDIYQSFRMRLKQRMYYPPTAPQVSKYRLVDVFTSVTEETVKTNIIQNFTSPDGCCRVVIGTIAFGMGLDSPNVRRVIHWGPSADIESYVQESGRIGRDGQPATAILYFETGDLSAFKHVSVGMKEYCKNVNKCRKDVLFAGFDQSVMADTAALALCADMCCDICNNP
jgi:ATP-dependent DNA helicase RecQ